MEEENITFNLIFGAIAFVLLVISHCFRGFKKNKKNIVRNFLALQRIAAEDDAKKDAEAVFSGKSEHDISYYITECVEKYSVNSIFITPQNKSTLFYDKYYTPYRKCIAQMSSLYRVWDKHEKLIKELENCIDNKMPLFKRAKYKSYLEELGYIPYYAHAEYTYITTFAKLISGENIKFESEFFNDKKDFYDIIKDEYIYFREVKNNGKNKCKG